MEKRCKWCYGAGIFLEDYMLQHCECVEFEIVEVCPVCNGYGLVEVDNTPIVKVCTNCAGEGVIILPDSPQNDID